MPNVQNHRAGKSITYQGKTYPSIKVLAVSLHVNYNDLYSRLNRGRTIDEALEEIKTGGRKGKSITYQGKVYPSISSLARAFNISQPTLSNRLSNGWTIEEALKKRPKKEVHIQYQDETVPIKKIVSKTYNIAFPILIQRLRNGYFINKTLQPKPITFRGRTYLNLQSLTQSLHLDYNDLYHQLMSGRTIDEALSEIKLDERRNGKSIYYQGELYPSLTAFAKAFNVKYHILRQRLNAGYSIEEALNPEDLRQKPITYKGKTYQSITALANDYHLNTHTLSNRINSGYSIEEALKGKKAIAPTQIIKETKSLKSKTKVIENETEPLEIKPLENKVEPIIETKPVENEKILSNVSNDEKVVYKEIIFPNAESFAEIFNYKPEIVRKLLKNGWTPNEILQSELGKKS